MKIYYVSLVRSLMGYYVKFLAPSETIVRGHVAKYYGRIWCSVYSETEMEGIIANYGVKIINAESPIVLLSEDWE